MPKLSSLLAQDGIFIGLVLVLLGCAVALLIQLCIWQIRRPEAYPIWLPVIFFGSFIAVSFALNRLLDIRLLSDNLLGFVSGLLAQAILTVGYIMGYAGIIEYSPSAEILMVVSKHMPEGISEGLLKVDSLSEDILTGKRIRHLLHSGLIREVDGLLESTRHGDAFVRFAVLYRKAMFQPEYGEG